MKDKTQSVTPPSTSRRKEKHVSRACNGCRRRKSKCDGMQPVCGTCAAQQHDCTWTAEEDGRRPATKAQVDAMSMEIRVLKDERERQDALVDALRQEIHRLGGSLQNLSIGSNGHIPSPPRSPIDPSAPTALSITIPPNAAVTNAIGPGPAVPLRHLRAVSDSSIGMSSGPAAGFLGIPSPISHGSVSPYLHSPASQSASLSPFAHAPPGSPFAHSPASVTSSLPSPLLGASGSGQFLTVPGQTQSLPQWRGISPEPSLYASSTDDDEPRSALSDSEDGHGEHRLMSTFVNTGKRLLVFGDDEDMVALSSSSPLALSCSPPRTPARSRASSFHGSIISRPSTAASDQGHGSIDAAASLIAGVTSQLASSQSTPSPTLLGLGPSTLPGPGGAPPAANLNTFRFPMNPSAAPPGPPPGPAGASTSVFSIKPASSSGGLGSPTSASVEHDALCPCDWSRFLPVLLKDGMPLPSANSPSQLNSPPLGGRQDSPTQVQAYAALTQAEHDAALKEYFTYAASWQMRVVPRLFMRDMRKMLSMTPNGEDSPEHEHEHSPLRVSHYSASLHCAILAEAGAFAPPDSILAQASVRDMLARTARAYADAECTAPHVRALPSVLALTVLAQYHLGRVRGARLAFALFGMAVRLALSAGMNMDARSVLEDEEEVWEREWCWCALFVQDVDMSLHVGQELTMLPPRESTVPFTHPGDSLVGQTFARTIGLMRLAARMMSLLGANGSGHNRPSMSAVSALQTDLARWHADLPDPLQIHRASTSNAHGHILILHMAAQWVTILLHRPYYAGHGWTEDSRKFVDDAAAKMIRTISTYERLYGLRRAPLAFVQMTFVGGTAALVRADTLSHSMQKRRTEALAQAKQASDALRELAYSYPCAEGYANALDVRAEAVRENAGRHHHSQSSQSSLGLGHAMGQGSLGSLGHQRGNSSVSVSGASTTSSSYVSPTMNTPSPPSTHGHSHSVPAVVVQDANGGGQSALAVPGLDPGVNGVQGMDLDSSAGSSSNDQSALFSMFNAPADFSTFSWPETSETVDPFGTVTQHPFGGGPSFTPMPLHLFDMRADVRRAESGEGSSDMLGIEATSQPENPPLFGSQRHQHHPSWSQ